MPRRIPADIKREAVGMLQIHDDISLAHYLTGVRRRTLRHWRQELRQRQNGFLSEKTFSSDRKQTENDCSAGDMQHGAQFDSQSGAPIDASTAADFENLSHIRAKLMDYARKVADDLSPDQADSNRRTLALSRVLDRIHLLDQTLPKLQPKERPHWQDACDALLELDISPYELIQIEEKANALDESLRGRVYEYYGEQRRKERERNQFW